MRFNEIKKMIVLLSATSIMSLAFIPSAIAQDAASIYLPRIDSNTRGILDKLNQFPEYMKSLAAFLKAWMDPDTSDATVAMQANFTELGKLLAQNLDAQKSLQATLNSNVLNNDGNNVVMINNGVATKSDIATEKTLPYANDLIYSSMLDAPLFPKDPRAKEKGKKVDPALNYIKNASGMNLYHEIPSPDWKGTLEAQLRYQSYYNTVMAAKSFGSYVLSYQYAEKSQFNTLQKKLIEQASDQAKWFAKVSSENIGFVLRQLLFYQSQSFVLLAQLVQTQQQMVTAQTITNSLLISTNQINESLIISSAKGEQATI